MKIIVATTVLIIDTDDDKPNDNSVHDPAPPPLDDFLASLIREARNGHNPDIWSEMPHGPVFKV